MLPASRSRADVDGRSASIRGCDTERVDTNLRAVSVAVGTVTRSYALFPTIEYSEASEHGAERVARTELDGLKVLTTPSLCAWSPCRPSRQRIFDMQRHDRGKRTFERSNIHKRVCNGKSAANEGRYGGHSVYSFASVNARAILRPAQRIFCSSY